MRYALLIYRDPEAVAEPAAEDWLDYTRALKASGCLLGGEQLFETDTATTVRYRGGRLLTDGPFAETKEHLVGFYLIDVDDLDAALEWAARMPVITYGSVEVRAARSGALWQTALDE